MTADPERGDELVAALGIETTETFLVQVEADDVIAADAAAWRLFERFLGADPATAWVLESITHSPFQPLDEQGNAVGEMKLASSAKWVRDPNVKVPVPDALDLADALRREEV